MRPIGLACCTATIALFALASEGRGQAPGSMPVAPQLSPAQQSPAQNGPVGGFYSWWEWSLSAGDGKPGKVVTPPPSPPGPVMVPYFYVLLPSPVPTATDSGDDYLQIPKRSARIPFTDQAERQLHQILARPRELTPPSLAKIEKLIADGDERFRRQNYSLAAERFRTAARMGSADAYLREGFALVALGNYRLATIAFQNAQALKPDWMEDPFSLEQIYAPGVLRRTTEKLMRKLAVNPGQEGLLTSMCMQFYFSGDLERARYYATRASYVGGIEATLAESFLSGRKTF